MLCVIFGAIFSLHASAEEKLENVPSEELPISYLYDKIKVLEDQLKRQDDKVNSLENQVKLLSSQPEDFQGHSAIEPSFIVSATSGGSSSTHIPEGIITFDDKIMDPSDSFNITTGKFSVPVSGNYLFLFDSKAQNLGLSSVEVYVKTRFTSKSVYEFDTQSSGSHAHNFMFSKTLQEGNEIWLSNKYPDTLSNYNSRPMTFVGYKTS